MERQRIHHEVLKNKNAIDSLEWSAIINTFTNIFKLIEFLKKNKINSFSLVEEDSINLYLSGFEKQVYRDITQRKLYNVFTMLKSGKRIIQNPVPQFKAKDYSKSEQVLTKTEQRKVAHLINIASKSNPEGALICNLAFFHALSSKQIQNIQLNDIDSNKSYIYISNRAPVYLDELDASILHNHLENLRNLNETNKSNYLFVSVQSGNIYQASTISIRSRAKKVTGYSPKNIKRL